MKVTDYSKFKNDISEGIILPVYKDLDWTSFDVVKKVKIMFRIPKVGHAGTLDPKATGLLILATGKKTKEMDYFINLEKEYIGTICIGATTASFDTETEVNFEKPIDTISELDLIKTSHKFLGEIDQLPPMHSAVKYKGKRLYEFARKGEEISRKKRRVTISKFEISNVNLPYFDFNIVCSKGTYIRSLAAEFGAILGVGAYLKALTRVRIGNYSIEDSLKMDELKQISCSLK
jgi:tRNA pseudouridine55 synthase